VTVSPDPHSHAGKAGAASLSIVSNCALIVLKIVAGAITGSIAIITEAVHSSIDLLASIVAYLSVRKADEPADASHMYGHAKIENLAAAIVLAGVRILTRSSRVLVDEALPAQELDVVRETIDSYPGGEVIGFHKLRGRRAGSARYIDVHVQFAPGTTLERAHAIAHELQDQVRSRIRGAEVLVHLEPAGATRPPTGSRI
jgi:divalent metal cation (Fe/Co/Zn/Cd) transporter